ncbi:MAG: hypothetical protein V1702_02550 [Candidatus Woesearchaeota archaeon]
MVLFCYRSRAQADGKYAFAVLTDYTSVRSENLEWFLLPDGSIGYSVLIENIEKRLMRLNRIAGLYTGRYPLELYESEGIIRLSRNGLGPFIDSEEEGTESLGSLKRLASILKSPEAHTYTVRAGEKDVALFSLSPPPMDKYKRAEYRSGDRSFFSSPLEIILLPKPSNQILLTNPNLGS